MPNIETVPIINGPAPKAENMSGVKFDAFCKFLLDKYLSPRNKRYPIPADKSDKQ